MAEVTLIARFVAKPGKEAELKTLLASVVATTNAEQGCKIYDLYESAGTGRFFFWELWESQEALNAHSVSAHIKKMREHVGDLIAEPVELSHLKAVQG
jgi:quinol monooxygenase YgiN